MKVCFPVSALRVPKLTVLFAASVVFISDVGANYKTLFICICCVTSGFYILTMLAERWLRHVDRLPSDVRRREQIFDWLAIFFCCVGSAGLILLSIVSTLSGREMTLTDCRYPQFDTFNHSTVHWSMTIVFIVGVALSAIFQSAEIVRQESGMPMPLRRTDHWYKFSVEFAQGSPR